MSKLYEEYKKQKGLVDLHRAAVYAVLNRMVEVGEAKRIEGPDEPGYPLGFIVTEDKELLKKIVAWDFDDDADIVFYFDEDAAEYVPHRCDKVELW